jgi:hypothetical protein
MVMLMTSVHLTFLLSINTAAFLYTEMFQQNQKR